MSGLKKGRSAGPLLQLGLPAIQDNLLHVQLAGLETRP